MKGGAGEGQRTLFYTQLYLTFKLSLYDYRVPLTWLLGSPKGFLIGYHSATSIVHNQPLDGGNYPNYATACLWVTLGHSFSLI